jgi:NhaC family Na+:H+ antiporter
MKEPRLSHALIPVLFLVFLLSLNVLVFKGTAHIPIICATAVCALVGKLLGRGWKTIEKGMVSGIAQGLQACLILLLVGVLIGVFIVSGVVPAMVFYGLKLLSPRFFLVSACLICSVVSLATGSSWSTAGTVGLALIGIGQGLGVPIPMVAGAIVSGSYLGDKMSPLSDTTNLAPAVAGTDLFTHIKHMMFTTVPSYTIALCLYFVIGLVISSPTSSSPALKELSDALEAHFVISPLLLIPPCFIIVLVLLRIQAIPALFLGTLVSALFAVTLQGKTFEEVLYVANAGYKCETGVSSVDALLSKGGLGSMYSTLGLIICALAFGGAMEACGFLETIAKSVLRLGGSVFGLILATLISCIVMNIIAPDQYLSIVVPGRMYQKAYLDMGLHPKNLSRALEDAGTLSSPLVPWNTCGAFMSATLAVPTLSYLPFAFLNLTNPLVSAFYGYTGITITRLGESGGENHRQIT